MKLSTNQQNLLKEIPSVDTLLNIAKSENDFHEVPKSVLLKSIRYVIDSLRDRILSDDKNIDSEKLSEGSVMRNIRTRVSQEMAFNLVRTVNATGVVVHTNLGRSLLPESAIENVTEISTRFSNLEFDLKKGKRGLRYSAVEDILCEITGAEAAMVVNNNAAAVLLCLETIASKKEVIVSRGELVEIGGSFRIPDVMTKSGAFLKEVGTTNRTHLADYENGISDETGMLLKVHTSNFSVVGFTASVSLDDMVKLGNERGIPVMDDLGSGTFVDFSKYGMTKEPTVQESVAAGTDIVSFSGDKLLGGPQAGIIVGKQKYIEMIRKNPLTRALRIDKMTLAALESTLRIYRDETKAVKNVPTLRMLTVTPAELEKSASLLKSKLDSINDNRLKVKVLNLSSKAGGGSLPLLNLPSKCLGISIDSVTPNQIERSMRNNTPPIIGRIEEDIFIMDMRTIQADEFQIIETAFRNFMNNISS